MGNNIIVIATLVGACLAPLLASKLTTRTIIIGGQLLEAIFISLVGLFTMQEQYELLIIFMFAHLCTFQLGMSNVFWIYVGSIACEKANAIAGGVIWGGLLLFSLFTQTLFAWFTPAGIFFSFGGLCFIGVIVFISTIKQTHGLTKEEI